MMKKFCVLGIAIGLACFVSCEKQQQTEAEKNAEIERQVQQRLAAEHQAEEQQKLAQREADLKAREDALAQKEQESTPTATPQMRASDVQQREVTEADSGEPASYDTFYTKLEPYGAWFETSDYGYVWQPNEAERSRSWRPYTNGRWFYTDAGWTWNSDEPFGWATCHYGRWARLRSVGWVWIPGDEWAPAWVSWRKGNDYVGWAPLPPEARFERGRGIHNRADSDYDIGPDQYCFVPTDDLGAERIANTIVPVERNVTIINQTTNVTNITYNNTTIVNQGPNFEELRRRGRHPIPQLRLERRPRFENANPHAVVRGDSIEMPAPAIAPARPADRPRKVKEKIAKPVVEHGWADIRDKKAVEQARAKIKAEAASPESVPPSKVTVSQPPQPNESVQPAETPVRNYPERAKQSKPHAIGAISPGIKAGASPSRQETKNAMRRTNELERAEAEKMRADKKVARQQEFEELRKARAAKNQSSSPSEPSVPARATPSMTPTATPTAAETSPTPQMTTPYARELPERASPNKGKKKEKRNRESPSP